MSPAIRESPPRVTQSEGWYKTGNNSDKAAVNLKFLLDAGLISDADRRKNIEGFLVSRAAGEGPALPSQTSAEEVTRKMFEEVSKSIQSLGQMTDSKQQETLMKMMMQMMRTNPQEMQKAPKPTPR
jgi:hypothetical protein